MATSEKHRRSGDGPKRVVPIELAKVPTGLTAELTSLFERAPEGATHPCAGVGSNNIDRDALALIKRAGVPRYAKPFHTLRKNRATELAAAGIPQYIVSEWMGHDPDIGRDFYQAVPDEYYAAPEASDESPAK